MRRRGVRQLSKSDVAVETFMARLYVDPDLRARFLAAPRATARAAGLAEAACDALARIDRDGLAIAGRSFAAKRGGRSPRQAWIARMVRRLLGPRS